MDTEYEGIVDASGHSYGDALARRKPSGAILVDGQQVADTVQCVHCGGHFVMRKGSGRVRGWCATCTGMICGPRCAQCVPLEQRLDRAERLVTR